MERSFSVDDAYRFGECVGQNTCVCRISLPNAPALFFLRSRLAATAASGQTLSLVVSSRAESQRCGDVFRVRTGVVSAELNCCAQTIGCELDPIENCLKGRLGG